MSCQFYGILLSAVKTKLVTSKQQTMMLFILRMPILSLQSEAVFQVFISLSNYHGNPNFDDY